jgi:hypothetical protein
VTAEAEGRIAAMDDAGLPPPVARYLRVAYPEGAPEVESAVIEASGRFRQRPLPWIRMRNTVWARPGLDRVSDLFVRVGPVTVLRVLDASVDGHGITKFLTTADVGHEIDQGSVHALLCEALMFPSAWSRVPGLTWEEVDDRTARMVVAFKERTETATIGFDPSTGFPFSYSTARYQRVGGPKVDWHVGMRGWRRFGAVTAPERLAVRWANEPGPWLLERFSDIRVGVDVRPAIERARKAIARARASSA